jgi:hypothetical protein
MSDKCKLMRVHEYKNPLGKTMVSCPLFDDDICYECCFRITQTISDIFHQVLSGLITPEELNNAPMFANGLISKKLKKYSEKILTLRKGWGECNKICTECRGRADNPQIIGRPENVGYPGLMPVRKD